MYQIIYHNKDLDGFVSAMICIMAIGKEEITLHGWDYGKPIPEIPEGDSIIMTDISFPPEDMVRLRENNPDFKWIDHHKTAISDSVLYGYDELAGRRLVGDSATLLAWNYFNTDPYPPIVYWTDRYDVWKTGEDWDKVMAMQYGMRHFIKDPAKDNDWRRFFHYVFPDTIRESGEAIWEYIKEQNKKLPVFTIKFEGLKFLVINGSGYNSTFANSHIDETHDAVMTFFYNGVTWKISMYSHEKTNSDPDLSIIAKSFGGGGHRGACGFTVPDIGIILQQNLLK